MGNTESSTFGGVTAPAMGAPTRCPSASTTPRRPVLAAVHGLHCRLNPRTMPNTPATQQAIGTTKPSARYSKSSTLRRTTGLNRLRGTHDRQPKYANAEDGRGQAQSMGRARGSRCDCQRERHSGADYSGRERRWSEGPPAAGVLATEALSANTAVSPMPLNALSSRWFAATRAVPNAAVAEKPVSNPVNVRWPCSARATRMSADMSSPNSSAVPGIVGDNLSKQSTTCWPHPAAPMMRRRAPRPRSQQVRARS